MSMVVETGTARCPRCMVMAKYSFYENGDKLIYEVSCQPCGNVYSEVCSPILVASPAA